MPDFLLPDLGEGLEQAEVVAWRVQVGERVVVDQVVVEVETAKAAVEVPVPFAGTVSVLHAAPGATVAVGAPLISVVTEDAGFREPGFREPGFREPGVVTPDPGSSAAGFREPGFREPGVVTPDPGSSAAGDEGSGNVLIGYGTSTPPRRHRSRRGATHRARRETEPPAVAAAPPAGSRTGPVPVISPIVRKLARDAGLDLTAVPGTGPNGLVRRRDVDLALADGAGALPAATDDGTTRIPIRGLRKAVADKLTRSRREIPEATVWVDVDATELLAARAALNARRPEQPVSLIALLARFTVLALRRYPELNARIEHDEIVIPAHVHLGFAAQTERGLVVPVVRDAHRLSTRELSAALAERTAAARAGSLTPIDLTGGTITVNNYGVFGVDGSAAIINYPEVAILGLGRIIDRPWVLDGQLVVRKVSQVTLAFDHRVCDGGTAGGFLRYVADCIESPVLALGDL